MKNIIKLLPIALSFFTLSAVAETITIPLSDDTLTFPNASGTVMINADDNGVDELTLLVDGLDPNRGYSVFLAASHRPDALPVQFLGTFTTDGGGAGSFLATTEVIDAFAASNVALTNTAGLSPEGAGRIDAGAVTVGLEFLRVYQAVGNGINDTAFGANENIPGGSQVLATEQPFDNVSVLGDALIANAGDDITVAAPATIATTVEIPLSGAASQGDIVSFDWEIIQTIDTGIAQGPCIIQASDDLDTLCYRRFGPEELGMGPLFAILGPQRVKVLLDLNADEARLYVTGARLDSFIEGQVFNDLRGEQIIVQLTVTDSSGNVAIDTVTVTFQ